MDSAAPNDYGENGKESCDYKKQINCQLQLIHSLRVRIEELETDSIIKNQSINKLQQEISDLRINIQTICDNINDPSGSLFGSTSNYHL